MRRRIEQKTSQRIQIVVWGILVVIVASLLFAIRYLPAFGQSNFYAEDGTVFMDTIHREGYASAAVEPFNGYLVVGQYIIAGTASIIHALLSLKFYQLPVVIAFTSCVFMGVTFSLPYLLLRKQLGITFSLLAVLFGALMPMVGSDYAIVGTIGNTKFAFLYIAFLFLLYRNAHYKDFRRVLVSDIVVLLCVLTNVAVLLLLPFAIWPYRHSLLKSVRQRNLDALKARELMSLAGLMTAAIVYVGVAIIKGIPAMPGYLDSPYKIQATLKLLYRVTLYVWTYPLAGSLRGWMVVVALTVFCWIAWRKKQNRFVLVFGLWAILSSTLLFVMNRPGISDFYLRFQEKTTDQFFYAQGLVFMFITIWVVAAYARRIQFLAKTTLFLVALLLAVIGFREGSSHGLNAEIYKPIGDAEVNVRKVCAKPGDPLSVSIYPSQQWRLTASRRVVCD